MIMIRFEQTQQTTTKKKTGARGVAHAGRPGGRQAWPPPYAMLCYAMLCYATMLCHNII